MNFKAMMLGAASMAGMVAVADVNSANIVGYFNKDKTDLQYVSVSYGFGQVGDDSAFRMDMLKPTTWSSGSDVLQELENEYARTVANYVWYGTWEGASAGVDEGWWDYDFNDMYNDAEFDVGTAFLGNFAAKDVAFNQSGEVLQGGTELDFTGLQYCMFGNTLPCKLTLGDISVTSWSSGSDVLQVLETEYARTVATYVWYGTWEGATAGVDEGWWDYDFNDMYNDYEIEPGDAFLGNFSAKDVVMTFPDPADIKPVEE